MGLGLASALGIGFARGQAELGKNVVLEKKLETLSQQFDEHLGMHWIWFVYVCVLCSASVLWDFDSAFLSGQEASAAHRSADKRPPGSDYCWQRHEEVASARFALATCDLSHPMCGYQPRCRVAESFG